ncbi:hypothetical protein J2T56_002143 [Natronobacillus azotifigens]|uniref:Uncharacterized protein n=1 Tax=Natronobacillus azotifigens TaxID=472978 RepID=A0A9J6REU1_9BACI|nr:hypothetical protein [Natronobacillus azotifigens]MCZ0703910.1 hypothetical protein [Natronobacillus azotifigens]
MTAIPLLLLLLLVSFSFFLNILGFMRIIPLVFTLPLLFFSIYFSLATITRRNSFRGFK